MDYTMTLDFCSHHVPYDQVQAAFYNMFMRFLKEC